MVHMETTKHLCLHCCFAREVWHLVQEWTDGLISVPMTGMEIEDWLEFIVASRKHRK
ncbi:hypothetical protein GQ55_7G148000 [Panicum hallii var. hallii]|uniref:Uncharacterized protein n=1 Tax=Panicum hallii var. hallii TaxID=1504633 RepID=A0A2T7CVF4_9POAL|nr:hypothetical protein GQ55_7G148000 [Panicum hallii var. hallii]